MSKNTNVVVNMAAALLMVFLCGAVVGCSSRANSDAGSHADSESNSQRRLTFTVLGHGC
jgi:hypothetical protein